ncbi:MAG: hypothetical protein IJ122_06500 [Methanobrevibacter sp.]|nr:hypothetical protein [Methanobrevibacter sp.]
MFFEEAEKLYKQFKKKAKIKDLKYVAQLSKTQDDEQPVYAIQFSNIVDTIAPVTFIDKSDKEVLEKVKAFLETMDYDTVEMKYHESQAYHANETAKRHLKLAEEIKNRVQIETEIDENNKTQS